MVHRDHREEQGRRTTESSVAIVTRITILQKNAIPNMVIRLG